MKFICNNSIIYLCLTLFLKNELIFYFSFFHHLIMFQDEKMSFLAKKDKSRKGFIDEPIMKLIMLLNSKENYFTTSSCSGRILLMEPAKRKESARYLFCSHEAVIPKDLNVFLDSIGTRDVWLKQENAIIHVSCRSLGDASFLVNSAKSCGFRRSGITAFGRKIVVEICSHDNI